MRHWVRTLACCLLLLLGSAAVAGPRSPQESDEAKAAEADARAKEREERIQEYLRKKEERRLRRESEQARKEDEAAAKRTAEDLAAAAEPAAAEEAQPEAPAKAAKEKKVHAERQRSALPRRLERIHEQLAASAFGQDATVAPYMALIASGAASAQQIAAFGNFLGQSGRHEEALAYYDLALSLDDADATIWLNAGTLQRQIGNLESAAGAYSQALGIDPSYAYAHYNLGAVLDEMGDYDNALQEYKLALVLDPALGDPAVNPQAANNEKLVAVRLMLYKEQAGSLGLPLVTIPNGEVRSGN